MCAGVLAFNVLTPSAIAVFTTVQCLFIFFKVSLVTQKCKQHLELDNIIENSRRNIPKSCGNLRVKICLNILQVRFVYEVIKKLRPGTTLLALHGAMPQLKRVGAYQQFCRKQNAVLIATDIAARGLGQCLQLMYIHVCMKKWGQSGVIRKRHFCLWMLKFSVTCGTVVPRQVVCSSVSCHTPTLQLE